MADTLKQPDLTSRIDVPGFRGELIEPGDPAYEEARAVYNGSVDRRPRLIARCVDTADVIAAVNAARERGLTVAVRGGTHHAAGLGTWDDALVVDLGLMRGVHVDPENAVVRVEGGARWGDVDHATHAFGLAVPNGLVSTTGVGGLTLGGGVGYLARQYGLTIDNLLSADLVLADGSVVTADEEHHADLFWALRGGGGNFGIVTSFAFRGRPVRDVVGGPIFYALEDVPELMKRWERLLDEGPDNLNVWFGFVRVPSVEPFPAELHDRPVGALVVCYNGAAEDLAGLLQPVREVGPLLDAVQPLPWPALTSMFDGLYPAGHQWYWKADWVEEIGDEAIAQHMVHGPKLPTPQSTMHLYPVSGAARRVPAGDTAFGQRRAKYLQVIVGVDPEPARYEEVRAWARGYHDALHPYSTGGSYVNMMEEEEPLDVVKASYGDNFARLVEVKRRYDPTNFFHITKNIPPDA
jgi:FAD/FMN-containing dehydrogenase